MAKMDGNSQVFGRVYFFFGTFLPGRDLLVGTPCVVLPLILFLASHPQCFHRLTGFFLSLSFLSSLWITCPGVTRTRT
jgi:hypothetical protein